MKRIWSLLLTAALLLSPVTYAGVTSSDITPQNSSAKDPVRVVRVMITSDASGNASGVISGISGTILQVGFKPSATSAPTDLYDLSCVVDSGVDIFSVIGANLSATVASQETPTTSSGFPFVVSGDITITATNMGNSKSTILYIYYR